MTTSTTTHPLLQQTIKTANFDAIIIGSGGAGLRAALKLTESELNTAVISKVFPTRSHTIAAQGGINAALANVQPDNWEWHMYDTVKGSDFLGDQDAIEFMCQQASQNIIELDHMGLPFSRLDNGHIYQRPFGGQSQHFGGEQAARTCAAEDRTGHALLHTLYQQNLRLGTCFYDEHFAIDLLKTDNGRIGGVLAYDLHGGQLIKIAAHKILIATGGAGQMYKTNTNASINTGDGMAMIMRAGLPLQDMEFVQFHPTGLAGLGTLMSEGTRGEGGFLVNSDGERFMKRYAPNALDLASRDVVSRAIAIEVQEGRGVGPNKDHVYLQLHHLDPQVILERLPGIRELSMQFLEVDPITDPIPVYPTAHYVMGGIPTNLHGQVLDQNSQVVPGLYAMGECACVSVHGANRLGGNSLLDLVVFGRAAAQHAVESTSTHPIDAEALDHQAVLTRLSQWHLDANATPHATQTPAHLLDQLQRTMQDKAGVFREAKHMADLPQQLDALQQQLKRYQWHDTSCVFNTEFIHLLEVDNLMTISHAVAHGAMARQESRGAHSRLDYPERDDTHWLVHSLYTQGKHTIDTRPVNLNPTHREDFKPVPRTY